MHLTRGTADLLSRKLIVAPCSLTVPRDSQTSDLLMLMRDSVHCPWKQATAPSVLEEEWNPTSRLHVTGVTRTAGIYLHVIGMPWLPGNEIDHVNAELRPNRTCHVQEPCTMHVTRVHQ